MSHEFPLQDDLIYLNQHIMGIVRYTIRKIIMIPDDER